MTKPQNILLILDMTPSRKGNVITWKQELTSSRITLKQSIQEMFKDHIPSELIQVAGGKLFEEIHKLIVVTGNKEELPQKWEEPIVVPIHKNGTKKIIIEQFHSCYFI